MTATHLIGTLNSLLRGELAATETYQQALDKLGDEPAGMELRRIHHDHREAANTLRMHVHTHGGEPDQGSGAWGTFAQVVEGAATIFGNTAALKALKEGELQGASDYEAALRDPDLPIECSALIRTTLLPQTRAHVHALDLLMDTKPWRR